MIVKVKDYSAVLGATLINKSEAIRYCGGKNNTELSAILEECIKTALPLFTYKICYTEAEISISGNTVSFPFFETNSKDLAKNLEGCKKAIVFCATIGIGIDRLIKKYSDISPVKALVFQGIGTERIEALCDEFCKDIVKDYGLAKPRFSPGYGDFKLEFQHEIFKILQCGKNIGVTLNESLLMSPTKSVTAIIGV